MTRPISYPLLFLCSHATPFPSPLPLPLLPLSRWPCSTTGSPPSGSNSRRGSRRRPSQQPRCLRIVLRLPPIPVDHECPNHHDRVVTRQHRQHTQCACDEVEDRNEVLRPGGHQLVPHRVKHPGTEDADADPVPNQSTEKGRKDEAQNLETEFISRERFEVQQLVQPWEHLPCAQAHACNRGGTADEQRPVFQRPRHPGPSLVVDKQHSEHLRSLDEENCRVH
mmetsp:Transcript_42063/g.83013  ORF Transcript_42063/g.83013 Transcript_42063/m.83013 type:complete len:223 (+) Transcript_42063:1012-1680(+)